MIYRIIRRIVKISLFVYFKKIVFTGTENIPENGPLIIVANHPNTFMDPMIIVAMTKQRIGFVANAGIFTNKFVSAIFRFFHVIPVFRKKDVPSGQLPDNRDTFVKCHEYLSKKGTFLIFPEGSSYYELNLREIKTGTARIALSFDQAHNFCSDLRIVPVALDYSDSIQFRSLVSVVVNLPISVSDYKEIYLKDEKKGVNQLTEDIRKALARNIPRTSGKDKEEFLIKAHKFYAAYYEPGADLYIDPKRSLELRKELSDALYSVSNSPSMLQLYLDTQAMIYEFFEELRVSNLTTGFFTDRFLEKNRFIIIFGYFFEFILLLPVYLFGLITNYIPYILPSKIYELSGLDIEYKTPVQMVSGLITFPFFYAFEIWLFRVFVLSGLWSSLFILILLPVSGFIAIYYWTEARRFIRIIRFYFMYPVFRKVKTVNLRNDILAKMEEARNSLASNSAKHS